MKLVRLVFLDLDPPIKSDEIFNDIKVDDVTVSTDAVWNSEDGYVVAHLLSATLRLKNPLHRVNGHKIALPLESVREAERAIEHAANLVAVAKCRKRNLGSPQGLTVVLVPETEAEHKWLLLSKGIVTPIKPTVAVTRHHQFDLEPTIVSALADRSDGVLLLSEALSHAHATGRFHDLYRLLERAFALGPGALVKPLAKFLATAPYNFTEREVSRWSDLRGPITHADRRSHFLVESDVRPVIDRLEFAAYDVLLHKEQWRSSSSSRRNPDGRSIAGETSAARLQNLSRGYVLIDALGTWPTRMVGPEVQPRAEWWIPPMRKPKKLEISDAFVTPLADRY